MGEGVSTNDTKKTLENFIKFRASLENGNLLLVSVSISLGLKTSHFLIAGQHKQSLSGPNKLEFLDKKKAK